MEESKKMSSPTPPGGEEVVRSRSAGSEDRGLLLPLQDKFTDSRRQKYGETERFFGCQPSRVPDRFDVNQVHTKRNIEKSQEIINADGFYNHSCSG